MSLSLLNSLKLPVFSNAKVIGGHDGLSKSIDTVNVMVKLPVQLDSLANEKPNILSWLNKNQLVLTTELVVNENIHALLQFLNQMSSAQATGLIIKAHTDHDLPILPEPLIMRANSLKLPLIVLPNDNSIGEIMSQVLAIILNAKQVELERTITIHNKFSRLFLRGASMSDIAQTLTSFIHYPVIVVNTRFDILGCAATAKPWIDSLASEKDWVHFIINQPPTKSQLTFYKNEQHKKLGIYPIHSSGLLKGYFIILNIDSTIEPSLMPLEQAAQIVAYESIKQAALLEGSNKLRDEFFSDFFENRLTSSEEILKRGEKYGLVNYGYYWVVSCKLLSHALHGQQSRHINSSHYEALKIDIDTYLEPEKATFISTIKDDSLIIIFNSTTSEHPIDMEAEWIEKLTRLQEQLAACNSNWATCFGISNATEQLEGVPRAYQEAMTALTQSLNVGNKPFVVSYRVQQVPDLIRLLPYHKLSEYYVTVLQKLAYPKTAETHDLLLTLDTYLQMNCNVKETASALFLHRNTVFYKLNKCESILNISLKDPVDLIKLRIALIIHQILITGEKQD
ncbi:PucR family transcriptional regulator [Paenibacillus sp. FSL W7-1287]|uniref:PucR family transcriptional regulator n=1 Tax=Paenibacillus sp. FSL W7-1287 TaxID=2954538 RepID=UPI0030F7DEB0